MDVILLQKVANLGKIGWVSNLTVAAGIYAHLLLRLGLAIWPVA